MKAWNSLKFYSMLNLSSCDHMFDHEICNGHSTGVQSKFTSFFDGYLAGLSILPGHIESPNVVECMVRCKEGLAFTLGNLPVEVARLNTARTNLTLTVSWIQQLHWYLCCKTSDFLEVVYLLCRFVLFVLWLNDLLCELLKANWFQVIIQFLPNLSI